MKAIVEISQQEETMAWLLIRAAVEATVTLPLSSLNYHPHGLKPFACESNQTTSIQPQCPVTPSGTANVIRSPTLYAVTGNSDRDTNTSITDGVSNPAFPS